MMNRAVETKADTKEVGVMADLDQANASRVIKRQRVLLIITACALAVCVLGLVATFFIKSPAQRAAEQAPPPPTVLTSPVVKQVLTQQVTVRGTVVVSSKVPVGYLGSASPAVVTGLPVGVGDEVVAGQVVAEVSGRPIIVLTGEIPAYRSLYPGDKGKDVAQLQASLEALGRLASYRSGTYDWATEVAVDKLYKDLGYESPDSVPLGEVVYISSDLARVGTLKATIGMIVGADPLLTLNTGAVVVQATVPGGQQVGIAAGQTVAINDDVNRRQAKGVVDSIGEFQGSAADSQDAAPSSPGYPLVVTPGEGMDTSWVGASVGVTIIIGSTPTEVLSVPVSAVQTGEGDNRYVSVKDGDTTRRVSVVTGMIAQGLVEITPADGESLSVGDLVVIG
jgi:hypothetical protein